jgi:YYY domain-containing protein
VSDPEAVVRWLAVLAVLSIGFAPLTWWLFRALPSRGAGAVLPLAMVAAVWPGWFAAAGFGAPYATWMPWATAAVAGLVGWSVLVHRRLVARSWLVALLAFAAGWLALFLGAVWVRGFTPDLLHTEKPMEAAFLSASAIATTMPPSDPWFAGEPINYYYLGYVLLGSVARMADVPATTAFNLAIPTLFAATFVGAAGFAWDALRRPINRRVALMGAAAAGIGVAVAGNLYAPMTLLRHGGAAAEPTWMAWWSGAVGFGWRSSRIVCDGPRVDGGCTAPSVETINEFPFFSFLLGDLHPHVMALPLTILVLTLALERLAREADGSDRSRWGWAVAAGATAGSLYAVNSWDFPTMLLILVGAVWLANPGHARNAALETLSVGLAAVGAWLPFWLRFAPPTGGDLLLPDWASAIPVLPRLVSTFAVHAGERTSLGEYLTIFGIPLMVIGWLLVDGIRRLRSGREGVHASPPTWIVGAVGGLAVLAVVLRPPVLLLTGAMAAAALWLVLSRHASGPRLIAVGLIVVGAALSAGVELLYIRDVFDNRMNTLFKIYYQVWTLFSLAAAIGFGLLWGSVRRPGGPLVLAAGTIVATAAMLAYPIVATRQWTDGFAESVGLDGIAFVRAEYPDEHDAILWLRQQAGAGDVILEAAGCSYSPNGDLPFNRVSAYAGLPTVIGWGDHQRQWRGGQPGLLDEIVQRQSDVARIFADPEGPLVDAYGIDWLIVGRYEESDWQFECEVAGPYDGIDRSAFPGDGWRLAFERPTMRIWQRQSLDERS